MALVFRCDLCRLEAGSLPELSVHTYDKDGEESDVLACNYNLCAGCLKEVARTIRRIFPK